MKQIVLNKSYSEILIFLKIYQIFQFIVKIHIHLIMKQFDQKNLEVPVMEPVKFIERSNGTVKGYAVNTYHGLVKKYNEDRVSIIMNITKPHHKGRWPRCSYFGVFDGHGGNACADFLKENLHRFITEDDKFPVDPISALKGGFRKAEEQFVKYALAKEPIERSGSCAIVLLIIDEICYIANVGDSRAVLSSNLGQKVFALSKDHKPQSQKQRIISAGGTVYQSIVKLKNGATFPGPYRINPGKLSVSRSFGDIQAKLEQFQGNPKVLIAKPEITYFEINPRDHDFIFMGSDGIFDKLTDQQIIQTVWDQQQQNNGNINFLGSASSKIIEKAMTNLSLDNLTSLVICFEDNGRLQLPRRFNRLKETQNEIQKERLFTNKSNSLVRLTPQVNSIKLKQNQKDKNKHQLIEKLTNKRTSNIEPNGKVNYQNTQAFNTLKMISMTRKSMKNIKSQVTNEPNKPIKPIEKIRF